MMLEISTTRSDTSSVMMVITTSSSTSVNPFLRLMGPPSTRLTIPLPAPILLLVLDAPGGGRRGGIPAVIAAGAPHVKAAGMQDRRTQRRGRSGLEARGTLDHLV